MQLSYGGHERIVEPHLHGFTSGGREVVLCWQLDGGSASNDAQPWRLFHIDRIGTLQVLEQGFREREAFSTVSREVPAVHCAVGGGDGSQVSDTAVS